MKFQFLPLLGLVVACGHLTQKNADAPILISQKSSQQFKRVSVQQLEASYAPASDLTPAIIRFWGDAERSKAKYLSHLTLTTYEGARSCVIILGNEEDLKAINTTDKPVDAPRRVNTDILSQYSKEKVFESKAFCKISGKAAAKDFVLVQARIYVPQEGANQNNAID